MRIRIAAFRNKYGSTTIIESDEDGRCWADEDDSYARVTEFAAVDLPEMAHDEMVAARLKSLEAAEEKLRAEFLVAVSRLQDERERLLALPAAGGHDAQI
jgi:hypothetical protein